MGFDLGKANIVRSMLVEGIDALLARCEAKVARSERQLASSLRMRAEAAQRLKRFDAQTEALRAGRPVFAGASQQLRATELARDANYRSHLVELLSQRTRQHETLKDTCQEADEHVRRMRQQLARLVIERQAMRRYKQQCLQAAARIHQRRLEDAQQT